MLLGVQNAQRPKFSNVEATSTSVEFKSSYIYSTWKLDSIKTQAGQSWAWLGFTNLAHERSSFECLLCQADLSEARAPLCLVIPLNLAYYQEFTRMKTKMLDRRIIVQLYVTPKQSEDQFLQYDKLKFLFPK